MSLRVPGRLFCSHARRCATVGRGAISCALPPPWPLSCATRTCLTKTALQWLRGEWKRQRRDLAGHLVIAKLGDFIKWKCSLLDVLQCQRQESMFSFPWCTSDCLVLVWEAYCAALHPSHLHLLSLCPAFTAEKEEITKQENRSSSNVS